VVTLSSALAQSKTRFKVELHQVYIFTSTVLRNLEQIRNAHKSGLASQRWRDVVEFDPINTINHNRSIFQSVSIPHFDSGALPDSHAAGDFAALYGVSQSFGE